MLEYSTIKEMFEHGAELRKTAIEGALNDSPRAGKLSARYYEFLDILDIIGGQELADEFMGYVSDEEEREN